MLIRTPDVLPNNLKLVRELRNKSVEEIASAIDVNIAYIYMLENFKANMGSSVAISLMDYLDCSFSQLFDMGGYRTLEYTKEIFTDRIMKLIVTSKILKEFRSNNIISVVKMIEEELEQYDLPGYIYKIEEISTDEIKPEKILLTLKVIIAEPITEFIDFDLDLSKNANNVLYRALIQRGFGEYELFSVNFIEDYLGVNRVETQKAIGLTKDGFSEILAGEKRIPVKIMWKLSKYFKVPLETIMNVPLYRKIEIDAIDI